MAGYTCVKCGETAHSKCARSRTVFPNDQRATMMANCVNIEANRKLPPVGEEAQYGYLSDAWEIKIDTLWSGEPSDEEAIRTFFEYIRTMPEEMLKHVLCKHQWRLDDEVCDLGCCHRK